LEKKIQRDLPDFKKCVTQKSFSKEGIKYLQSAHEMYLGLLSEIIKKANQLSEIK